MQKIDFALAPPGSDPQHIYRTIEVQTVDGEAVWLCVNASSLQEIADGMVQKRHLIGRYMGSPGDQFDAHRMIVPSERIKLIIDVDG
nr:hypothetical protein [uncultured Brevundimonas sp.]